MRQITIRAEPSSSRDAVERIRDSEYVVRTTEPPILGRANRAIIQLLAEHFDVSPLGITIVAGRTSRTKKISIHGL